MNFSYISRGGIYLIRLLKDWRRDIVIKCKYCIYYRNNKINESLSICGNEQVSYQFSDGYEKTCSTARNFMSICGPTAKLYESENEMGQELTDFYDYQAERDAVAYGLAFSRRKARQQVYVFFIFMFSIIMAGMAMHILSN